MSSAAIHRALDGLRFAYEGGVDLTHPATSVANMVMDGVVHEFTSGPSWAGDAVARKAEAQLDEEFACQGGTLRVGEAVTKDPHSSHVDRRVIAVWQGENYNLLTHLYNASTADVVALVNAFRIVERPDGIVITPEPGTRAQLQESSMCAKYVPGVGIVEAKPRDRREVQRLPSWPGAKVRFGELFRDTLTDGNPYFVLVTETAIVTVVSPPNLAAADVANGISELDVRVQS